MILLALALAWLGGLIAAALGLGHLWPIPPVAGFVAALSFLPRHRSTEAVLSVVCAAIAVAAVVRYEAAIPRQVSGIGSLNDSGVVTFSGTVATEPELKGPNQRFQFVVT